MKSGFIIAAAGLLITSFAMSANAAPKTKDPAVGPASD